MRVFPKKSLGQNFLVDRNIAGRIIEALELRPSDIILEIGSGKGELTSLIAAKVNKVYAVELDKRLQGILASRLKDHNNINIIMQDILKVDLGGLLGIRGKVKVFGNIPYYISSPIIEYLIKHREWVREAFITVQKEFARRVAASPGSKDYGAFSLFAQYYTLPSIVFQINRGCFYPVPKVDSSLLYLKFRDKPAVYVSDEGLLFRVIRSAFNQRRKTLKNSLKGVVAQDKIEGFLLKHKKSPNSRAEELSLAEFAGLANTLLS